MKNLFLFLSLTFVVTGVFGKTITVTNGNDSGAGSLRQAVIDAQDGDIINFENVGTIYFAGVIKIDKSITINGNAANNTIFQDAPVWTDTANKKRFFEILEDGELTLNHLTLKDHVGNCTGGAILSRGKLILNNCTFSNNRPYDCGGAVAASGTLNIENCDFINNYAPKGGGAIDFGSGIIIITNSRFIGNSAPKVSSGAMHGAGAIYISKSATASISNCTFDGNISSDGGAISNWGTITIDNCIFKKNKATNGGAISSKNQISINNSEFYENEAASDGIFRNRSLDNQVNAIATLTNCLFRKNTMTGYSYPSPYTDAVISLPGGLSVSQLTLINCTVADNVGTGISYFNRVVGSNIALYNTILWNNVSERNDEYDVYERDDEENVVFNAYNSLIGTSNINLSGNGNIINENPLFVGNSDYSLQTESPAIDAGDNSFYSYNDYPKDLADNCRIDNNTIDMGAYEYQSGNPFISAIAKTNNEEIKIYSRNRTIVVEQNTETVSIYNLQGICVAQGAGGEFPIAQAGVHIVRVGKIVKKVIVM